ncbi:bacteriohemerythrin [candidate division KSB1 bacterium]
MSIDWSEKNNVGIKIIDNQHSKIIEQFNRVEKVMEMGTHNRQLKSEIEKLEEIIETHFATEERYMKNNHYPEMNNHINEHGIYLKNIYLIKNAISLKSKKSVIFQTISLQIVNWYTNHISTHDSKLSEFLIDMNIAV